MRPASPTTSRQPRATPASTLTLTGPALDTPGVCVGLQVGLRDSSGAAAPAPYDVTGQLFDSGQPLTTFSTPGCATAANGVIAAGATQITVYVQSMGTGAAGLEARHVDFLPGTWVLGAGLELRVATWPRAPAPSISLALTASPAVPEDQTARKLVPSVARLFRPFHIQLSEARRNIGDT